MKQRTQIARVRLTIRRAALTLALLVTAGLAVASSIAQADPTTQPTTQLTTRPGPSTGPVYIPDDAPLPTGPGDHKLKFRTRIGDRQVEMSYLLHLPPDYNDPASLNPLHPMLVFYHGVGEVGTDLAGVYALGPMTLLKPGGNAAFAASCPFVVVCPQCPPRGQRWDLDYMTQATARLVDQVVRRTRTDPDRVYGTGLSLGGLGTWCVGMETPDRFAALAPLSAVRWHPELAGDRLKYVAVWGVVGLNDDPRFLDGTRAMQAALANDPLPNRFTYLLENGHDAWYHAYQNPQFFEWLLSRRRPSPAQRQQLDAQHGPPAPPPVPTTAGHYLRTFDTKVGDQPYHLDYVLYLPKDYRPGRPYPTILSLHEQDTIGPDYHDICMHGPDLALARDPALAERFPFVVISPRLPIKCDWQSPGMTKALLGLLDHVGASVGVDPARVYATGVNAGAAGACKLVAEAPDRFAALVPVWASGGLAADAYPATAVRTLPARLFLPADDVSSNDRASDVLRASHQDWQVAKLPRDANAIGNLPVYNDPALVTWLLAQHRPTAASASMK